MQATTPPPADPRGQSAPPDVGSSSSAPRRAVPPPPVSSVNDLTTDEDLIALVEARSEAGLAEIYNRYAPAVAGLARRVLSDEGLALDVVQDVFVALWDHPERFDAARGSLRTMLLTQTHGRAVDVIRAREARKRREDRVSREPAQAQPAVDAELMALTQAEAVRAALLTLGDEERQVLQLTYFEGHTYRSAATALGLPEGTVKGRIRSALRKLNAILVASETDLDITDKPTNGDRDV
jgi:RNA polymerase sigma-70 factor, ECF subfamily